jgi:diguanylate cyclase (GGDEF)-like protein
MQLDMLTVSAANVAVTTVLGTVLLLTWARERESPLVGWWGVALLLQGAGVAVAASASPSNVEDLVAIGTASIILGEALKWKASREFAGREARLLWVLLGPVGFLLAVSGGYLHTFDVRLNAVCSVLALYNFAAAAEFARPNGEPLASRRSAVVLLVIAGLGFLSWLPLNVAMPIQEAQYVLVSFWFPATILLTLLLRIALAFIVLSMAKERRELERRVEAMTDALTGLPNRRALFEAADALSQARVLKGDAISVLIFDLDHFKQTNDRFGHALGDRVLKLFATTAQTHLDSTSIVARLGGEEFAAILPGGDPIEAAGAAEAVRNAFANSAAFVDGLPVGGSVSVGVAWDAGIDGDLSALFRRADAALYVAKRAGRNRVELLGPDDVNPLTEVEAVFRAARWTVPADLADLASVKLRA